jgi:hypothetical protein
MYTVSPQVVFSHKLDLISIGMALSYVSRTFMIDQIRGVAGGVSCCMTWYHSTPGLINLEVTHSTDSSGGNQRN